MFIPDLTRRKLEPEAMDEPGLNRAAHEAALRGLARLNAWSGSARILWEPVRLLARETGGRPLRVLDVATGSGDLPVKLWLRARRAGIPVQVAGCDVSETALGFARNRARQAGAEVVFFQHDAIAGPFAEEYDLIVSSTFFHHLEREQAVQILKNMSGSARMSICINDLERTRAGWALAWLGSRVLTRSPIVHKDALLSVESAFTMSEILEIGQAAGTPFATVSRRWPYRFLAVWRNPRSLGRPSP